MNFKLINMRNRKLRNLKIQKMKLVQLWVYLLF